MCSVWQKSWHLICYVTKITARRQWKKDKNHMNHLLTQDVETAEGIFFVKRGESSKARTHLHMGASRSFRGADSLCFVSIFTTRQQGRVPWPCKETQMCFSLAMLTKIELLWRCCAIIASDCSVDKIKPVLGDEGHFSFQNMFFHTGVIKRSRSTSTEQKTTRSLVLFF